MYLLPDNSPARTKNKWGMGRLGIVPIIHTTYTGTIQRAIGADAPTPGPVRTLPTPINRTIVPVVRTPIPPPAPKPPVSTIAPPPPPPVYTAPPTTTAPTPILPPANSTTTTSITSAGTPSPSNPATAGTPVPANFPTNQLFIATDGSQWIYSVSGRTWLNTGVPYNVNAPAAVATSSQASNSIVTTPAAATPTDPTGTVAVAPAATDSYQEVLDWLSQNTLISAIPNWIIVAGAVGGYLFLSNRGGKR